MERASGVYEVKIGYQWTVATWNASEQCWILDGNEDDALTDNYFDEIGEKVESTNHNCGHF